MFVPIPRDLAVGTTTRGYLWVFIIKFKARMYHLFRKHSLWYLLKISPHPDSNRYFKWSKCKKKLKYISSVEGTGQHYYRPIIAFGSERNDRCPSYLSIFAHRCATCSRRQSRHQHGFLAIVQSERENGRWTAATFRFFLNQQSKKTSKETGNQEAIDSTDMSLLLAPRLCPVCVCVLPCVCVCVFMCDRGGVALETPLKWGRALCFQS